MAVASLARSLEQAVASPRPLPVERHRSLSWGTEDGDWARIPPPRVLPPPWQSLADDSGTSNDSRWDGVEAFSPSSTGSDRSATSNQTKGTSNNWSRAVPLPRLALLSGLTTLRLNVSLAGLQARVPSRGLAGDTDESAGANRAEKVDPVSTTLSPGARLERTRTGRARRCIQRVTRQLLERIHPAQSSPGYRESCRLFRDEMGALGYDQDVLSDVLRVLVETTVRFRDPRWQDEAKEEEVDGECLPPSMTSPAGSVPGSPMAETSDDGGVPTERDEAREMIEAGMAVLQKVPVSDDGDDRVGDADGNVAREEQLSLDIISVEVSKGMEGLEAPQRVGCLTGRAVVAEVAVGGGTTVVLRLLVESL